MDPIYPLSVAPRAKRQRNRFVKKDNLKFCLRFLLWVAVILSAYRASLLTFFNQAYLFSIAQSTHALLRIAGVYSSLENVGAFAGRENEVRRTLTRSPHTAAALDAIGRVRPLSSWEVYRFRITRLQSELRALQYLADKLKQPFPPAVADSPLKHVNAVESRLKTVQELLQTHKPALNQSVLTPTAADELKRLSSSVDELKILANDPTPEFIARLRTADEQIDKLRMQLAKNAADAVEKLYQIASSQGPMLFMQEKKENGATCPPFVFAIAPECGAVEVFALYISGILAFPAVLNKKWKGILLGVPILYALNVTRLAVLGLLGMWYRNPEFFTFVHEYLWQGLYIVFVASLWLAWVETCEKKLLKTP